jgi:hypothetical protein
MYLLDTNILSELRKGSRCDTNVRRWAEEELINSKGYVSVMALGEIRNGIDRLIGRDPDTANRLETWLGTVYEKFQDGILPVTAEIAEEWGRLDAIRPLPLADSLMAATANMHRLTFVTCNTRDFADTGVKLLDPFAG